MSINLRNANQFELDRYTLLFDPDFFNHPSVGCPLFAGHVDLITVQQGSVSIPCGIFLTDQAIHIYKLHNWPDYYFKISPGLVANINFIRTLNNPIRHNELINLGFELSPFYETAQLSHDNMENEF